MKRILIAWIVCVLVASCDPKDMPTEGITLPDIEFAFTVNPDTSYLKVGDTLTIYAAVSSTLSNGIRLIDGEGELWFGLAKSENIPMTSISDHSIPLNNNDYHLILREGGVKWAPDNTNRIFRLTSFPTGDSIIMHYKFVFLKKGLYQLGGFQSSFYEGSKGKGRWYAYYNVKDPNWHLIQVPGHPVPQPGEQSYNKNFLIAVTE